MKSVKVDLVLSQTVDHRFELTESEKSIVRYLYGIESILPSLFFAKRMY